MDYVKSDMSFSFFSHVSKFLYSSDFPKGLFAKKRNLLAGLHNGTPEYALKMIDKGFNFVTIGADQRAMSTGAKAIVDKMKGSSNKKEESKAY